MEHRERCEEKVEQKRIEAGSEVSDSERNDWDSILASEPFCSSP